MRWQVETHQEAPPERLADCVATASTHCGDPSDRRLPRVAGPCVLVMFGVTGDLSRKNSCQLSTIWRTVAYSHQVLAWWVSPVEIGRTEDFAKVVHDAVAERARTPFREEVWEQLLEGIRFCPRRIRR